MAGVSCWSLLRRCGTSSAIVASQTVAEGDAVSGSTLL